MPDTENGARYLVARSSRPVVLEVEVKTSKKNDFVGEYNQWCGGDHSWNDLSATGHALAVGEDKWGAEARMYFPKDEAVLNQMRRYGFRVEKGDVRYRNTFRVNNKNLFQELVQVHGLRLGYND